jgi:hypothetical protein
MSRHHLPRICHDEAERDGISGNGMERATPHKSLQSFTNWRKAAPRFNVLQTPLRWFRPREMLIDSIKDLAMNLIDLGSNDDSNLCGAYESRLQSIVPQP